MVSLSFCHWLTSLGTKSSMPFLQPFPPNDGSVVNRYHDRLIHSSVGRHLGGCTSWLLWIMLLWTGLCKYALPDPTFNSFVLYIFRSGHAGSDANSIFNFLRNHQSVFHSSCIILCSHQQGTRVAVSPGPQRHLLIFEFLLLLLSRFSHIWLCETP